MIKFGSCALSLCACAVKIMLGFGQIIEETGCELIRFKEGRVVMAMAVTNLSDD